ncbi:MAG: hypothetical protein R3240_14370 [Gammaproteobacteria bacterium]|nr:hypothetical protein [Gammaproteobacteria bacterium]
MTVAVGQEYQIKYGELESNQVWQGDIYLVSDVIIPEGIVLTIKPGTHLYFAEYDISQSGQDKQHAEIIVKGQLNAQPTAEAPIMVASINQKTWKQLNVGEHSVQLEFKPYQIDTQPMIEEFHLFKQQYVLFWSMVYAMWILAL